MNTDTSAPQSRPAEPNRNGGGTGGNSENRARLDRLTDLLVEDILAETDDYCPNCGGDGVVYSCQTEYACVDPESGCDECERRCDWCRPAKPRATPEPAR